MTLGAIAGSVLTLAIFLAGVIFRLGHHSARLEALEKWREDIRNDMHEISDNLERVNQNMEKLTTLIEERTERRGTVRS